MEKNELTEDQIKHIGSIKAWMESQLNFIENLRLVKENAERMIENYQESIRISDREIPIEEKYYTDNLNNFKDWCLNNGIDIPEWAH